MAQPPPGRGASAVAGETDLAASGRSPLGDRLVQLIRAHGPITVADYMADALFHPNDGYYMSQSPIGARGDFTTAPEVSQIFGELIGLWLVHAWSELGEPDYFTLVEIGPGRGVMMKDILRAAAIRPKFLKAARIELVETSGRLRHEQQKRLRDVPARIDWKDAFSDTSHGPILIVANELFDCMPIRQFVMTEAGWRERMVAVDETGERLVFAPAYAPPFDMGLAPKGAKPGDVFERSEAAEALMEEIAVRLATNKGRALIVDYGHVRDGLGETLQSVRNHRPWPPLAAPGHADITAHVNFERLVRTAFDAGAAVFGPVSQATLLDRLGLALRVERLCAGKEPNEINAIEAGAFRIAAASEMGELFKAIAVSSPELPAPIGFDAP